MARLAIGSGNRPRFDRGRGLGLLLALGAHRSRPRRFTSLLRRRSPPPGIHSHFPPIGSPFRVLRRGLKPAPPPCLSPPGDCIVRAVPVDALPYRYLAVDGPIGVGKTTLVEMLAQRFEGVKILEDVDNPFLEAFYRDRPGTAFQTELYFLLTRYKQQLDLAQEELFEPVRLADYTFAKSRLFAYLNLTDGDLMLFEKLYDLLEPQLSQPDLLIFLTADIDTCMARIHKRRRAIEQNISADYLGELIEAYNHHYYHYDGSPLLVVDSRNLDFEHKPTDFEELLHHISRQIRGTEYFVPARSA
ncbi:MAG: deoxynucleoside kinase [Holophagales bacterium]|nr:deoxynucleoside kinase [Holophagales bacterium]MYF05092.1 deoxynucleoside kinase [Holophagales bacterium]MYJ24172.1 deoxynucleoside kinase [Holophagales bacterium]